VKVGRSLLVAYGKAMAQVFRINSDKSSDYGYVESRPKRADGKYLKSWDTDAPSCQLEVGSIAGPRPEVVKTCGQNYLFSDRAMDVFHQFRLLNSISWIPVELTERGQIVDRYHALTNKEEISILDLGKSRYTWTVPGKLLGRIDRYVVSAGKLPPLDFFPAETGMWIVTGELKERLVAAHITGIVYSECEVS
jgi:hypothetical protein